MKIFYGQFNNQIIVMILMMHGLLSAQSESWFYGNDPLTTLPAYKNQVAQILCSVGSDDQLAVTFICDQSPICMYTPLSYADIDTKSVTKTYYLPSVSCTRGQLDYCSQYLHDSFKKVGVDVKIEEIKNFDRTFNFLAKNYGLRVSFTMQPGVSYDIAKVVDVEKKLVSFNFIGKI